MHGHFDELIVISILTLMLCGSFANTASASSVQIWYSLDNMYYNSEMSYRDVEFLNGTHGFVAGVTTEGIGGGVILATNDSGDSWFEVYHDTNQTFRQISIVNQSTIWVTGRGRLVYTTNGGQNWQNSCTIGSGTSGLSAVAFINNTHGWTSTNDILYATRDSGLTWLAVESWKYNDTSRDFYINASNIWIIGYYGIYYSSDLGDTWSQQFNYGGWALSFVDSHTAWAIADNMLAYSADGLNWNTLTPPRPSPLGGFNPPYFSDILFLTSSVGWIVGLETPVAFTPNGGLDWFTQNVETDARMNAIEFINETYGWMVGAKGTIMRTQKGNLYGERLWKGLTDHVIVLPIVIAFIGITSLFMIRRHVRKSRVLPNQSQGPTSIEPA
ncbi:MAG: YCF48-related protein [Candidatus Thorarchaeota archaeon]|nr:YCF48-related protein [Candidatus Thorarchaeota archaeon]